MCRTLSFWVVISTVTTVFSKHSQFFVSIPCSDWLWLVSSGRSSFSRCSFVVGNVSPLPMCWPCDSINCSLQLRHRLFVLISAVFAHTHVSSKFRLPLLVSVSRPSLRAFWYLLTFYPEHNSVPNHVISVVVTKRAISSKNSESCYELFYWGVTLNFMTEFKSGKTGFDLGCTCCSNALQVPFTDFLCSSVNVRVL